LEIINEGEKEDFWQEKIEDPISGDSHLVSLGKFEEIEMVDPACLFLQPRHFFHKMKKMS
jgi:hypothetical protein